MSEANTPTPKIIVTNEADKISITISASSIITQIEGYTIQAQKGILELLQKVGIKKVYYVDDIYEIIDNVSDFTGKILALIAQGKSEQLKSKISDINFELPEDPLKKEIINIWEKNPEKRGMYLTKILTLSGLDNDFGKDLKAKNKIEEYFPKEISFQGISPSEFSRQKEVILASLSSNESKVFFLFDNIFKHSPPPLNVKQGLDFIDELSSSENKEKIICGLITHTVEKQKELTERKKICEDKKIPLKNFLLLSKTRTERALQFADGIKKSILNSSCEIIKTKTIDLIIAAQKKTIDRLKDLDAYAFDHIIIDSSFREGVWEPSTLLRINDFLFGDNAKHEIDQQYKETINTELEIARSIGRIKIGEHSYNDHLSLRNQELYESKELINKLNSPIENGDIFEITEGGRNKMYILVTQPCDLMVRTEDGNRKSSFGTLLKVDLYTESKLKNEVKNYNRKDPFRQHYFADKYKLQYFENTGSETKIGVIDFNDSTMVDMSILDLAVFNSSGQCKIDLNNVVDLKGQLQSSWRERFSSIVSYFEKTKNILESIKNAIDVVNPEESRNQIWLSLMPNVSFVTKLGLKPSYNNNIFDFGITRIMRYREPNATMLLNRYTRHLSREAEEHDFAG